MIIQLDAGQDEVDWFQLPNDLLNEILDLTDGHLLGPKGLLDRLRRGIPPFPGARPSLLMSRRLMWTLNKKASRGRKPFPLVQEFAFLRALPHPLFTLEAPPYFPNLTSLEFAIQFLPERRQENQGKQFFSIRAGVLPQLKRLVFHGPFRFSTETYTADDSDKGLGLSTLHRIYDHLTVSGFDVQVHEFILLLKAFPKLEELEVAKGAAPSNEVQSELIRPLQLTPTDEAILTEYLASNTSALPLRKLSTESLVLMKNLSTPLFNSLLRNLTSIALSAFYSSKPPVPLPLFEIDCLSGFPNLRHISLGPGLYPTQSSLDAVLALPLKSLTLALSPSFPNATNLLAALPATLRSLTLEGYDASLLPCLSALGNLKKLRALHLEGTNLIGLADALPVLLPSLRSLILRTPQLCHDLFSLLFRPGAPSFRLQELEFSANRLLLDSKFFAALPSCCPRLRRLGLTFDLAFATGVVPLSPLVVADCLSHLVELKSLALRGDGQVWSKSVLSVLLEGIFKSGGVDLEDLDLGRRGIVPEEHLFQFASCDCLANLRTLHLPEIGGTMLSRPDWAHFAGTFLARLEHVIVSFAAMSRDPYLTHLIESGIVRVTG